MQSLLFRYFESLFIEMSSGGFENISIEKKMRTKSTTDAGQIMII